MVTIKCFCGQCETCKRRARYRRVRTFTDKQIEAMMDAKAADPRWWSKHEYLPSAAEIYVARHITSRYAQ